jgi:hypothetical protein
MSDEERRGAEGFLADVARMRAEFGARVPSYAAVLGHVRTMLEEPASVLRQALERAWSGRSFHVVYDRPLLLLAALRESAMLEGPSHPLFGAIGTDEPHADEATLENVRRALPPDRAPLIATLAHRWVQTNDTLRSVVWRWPAYLAGCEGGVVPLALVDLGASAGLNLVAERLPAVWTDSRGAAIPVATTVNAVARLGLDARPVDLTVAANVTWMRACIWPGDRGRGERLEAGLSAFFEAQRQPNGPILERMDVSGFAARLARVSSGHDDALVLAYQSYMRDYLPPDAREAHRAAMHEWLRTLPPGRAMWAELEVSPASERLPDPAAITIHVRCGRGDVRVLDIGRTSHHPFKVEPNMAAVGEVEDALRRWKRRARGC